MSAYHQMGHDSESMVVEPRLGAFAGAILSPVNYSLEQTIAQCTRFRTERDNFDIIFDPQLYVPTTNRGKLQSWPHKPSDIDTADLASIVWWRRVAQNIVETCNEFRPDAICSPAFVPRIFDDAYYDLLVAIGNETAQLLDRNRTRPMLTALVSLDDLARDDRYLQVGSILSKFGARDIYLCLMDDENPRYERLDSGALEGAARLIRALTVAGFVVTVGFTSSEIVLWKAAGAQHVASGKFFNLRRFTASRWDEDESSGGRNVWYWFEPSLLAFLREADFRRFRRDFPISETHAANPYSQTILTKLSGTEKAPWLADSWRQFLHWFAECEASLNGLAASSELVGVARDTWSQVHASKLKFEQERNNGDWVRSWEVVLNELDRRLG